MSCEHNSRDHTADTRTPYLHEETCNQLPDVQPNIPKITNLKCQRHERIRCTGLAPRSVIADFGISVDHPGKVSSSP